MSSVREYVLASVTARLAEQIPTATVERSRRAAVDTDRETLPRLVVALGNLTPDETVEVGRVHYTAAITITGHVTADTDDEADQAATDLHAAVVAALSAWTPSGWDVDTPMEGDTDFRLIDAADSTDPTAEFTSEWTMRVVIARATTGALLGEFILDVDVLT